jgi:biopolymer transport protein ExbD
MDASNDRGKLKAAPNVTPLVDVVLVLLILFIILLPAVDQAVKLPSARHASVREGDAAEPIFLVFAGTEAGPSSLRMEMGQGGRAFLAKIGDSGRPALVHELRNRLAGRDFPQVFLKADGRIPFHHIQNIFDLCREAGAEMVSVVTAADLSQPSGGGLS